MTAKLIYGEEIANKIREEIKQEVIQLKAKYNLVPGLATILLGTDPGSLSYITGKEKPLKNLVFIPNALTYRRLLNRKTCRYWSKN